jgi:type IV pilus assembly protein PilE
MIIHVTRRHAAGFSLIELMTTVAIVAILAMIAIPAYNAYVIRANRAYATNALQMTSQALQRCYSLNFTFVDGATTPCTVDNGTTTTPDGHYSIQVQVPQPSSFTLTATPIKAPQTNDSQCATFTLLSSGQQSAQTSQGTDSSQACWGSG